ncbi:MULTISPECIES: LLM class flavin-dependent oxidoreductase [unclassified Nocardia]|uniref:LLM class flavin-dependent oxidoreductase n=1 Tax=unclassified Nocardia TaxID=2637762 RepID=UPI001CE48E78|nr:MULTISPECIES: LLM class flavin-dependent oxidoreductase [unclassified Nocardia]
MSMRFGIILVPRSGPEWVRDTRAAEHQGYHTILLPDTLHTPSPLPCLAAAAAATTAIRLRPNVLAAPFRDIAGTVREVAALQLLSTGRFELGIGVGRPDAAAEAEKLGRPWGTAAERRTLLFETVAAVRASVQPPPPVVIAASGPKMLAAAAAIADRILLAAGPESTEQNLADMVRIVRDHTDRDIRFTSQLIGIGDQLPYWTANRLGHTPAGLRAAGAAGLLPPDPADAIEILEFHRDKYAIDELLVPAELSPAFTPILDHYR